MLVVSRHEQSDIPCIVVSTCWFSLRTAADQHCDVLVSCWSMTVVVDIFCDKKIVLAWPTKRKRGGIFLIGLIACTLRRPFVGKILVMWRLADIEDSLLINSNKFRDLYSALSIPTAGIQMSRRYRTEVLNFPGLMTRLHVPYFSWWDDCVTKSGFPIEHGDHLRGCLYCPEPDAT